MATVGDLCRLRWAVSQPGRRVRRARLHARAAAKRTSPLQPLPPDTSLFRVLRTKWWLAIGGAEEAKSSEPLLVVAGRLAKLAREDVRLIAAASFFMVSASLAELVIPLFLSKAIALAAAGSAQQALFGDAISKLLLVSVAFGVLAGCRGTLFSLVNQRLVRRLRTRLFSALSCSSIEFFDAHDVGGLTSRLGADCAAVARAVATNVNVLFRNALQVAIGGAFLAHLSPLLAAVAAVATASLFLVTARYGAFSRRAARALQDATAEANRVAEEAFALARTVRAFGAEATEAERYGLLVQRQFDINLRQSAAYGFYVVASNSLYHLSKSFALAAAGFVAVTKATAPGLSSESLTTFVLMLDVVLCAALSVADEWPQARAIFV